MLSPHTPELLSTPRSRRSILKIAGLGGAMLLGGGWLFKALRGFGPVAKGLRVFDEHEFGVLKVVSHAMFPGTKEWAVQPEHLQIPEFVDAYVSGLYPDTQILFRTLLRAFNLAALTEYGKSFVNLNLNQCQEVLHDWANSDSLLKRAGSQSLSFPINMGYFENDEVMKAAGISLGCPAGLELGRPTLLSQLTELK